MTDYATASEVKAQIEKTLTNADTVLAAIVTAASRAIDRVCNRPDSFFVADATASARSYAGSGGPYLWIDPCIAVTLVEVKDSVTDTSWRAWDSGDWITARGDPEDPDFEGLPDEFLLVDPSGSENHFPSGRATFLPGFRPSGSPLRPSVGIPTARVTAKWGYAATVPAQIKQAAIIQSARWYKRGQGSWSDALATADMGTLLFRKDLDPDLKLILVRGRFVKPATGAR